MASYPKTPGVPASFASLAALVNALIDQDDKPARVRRSFSDSNNFSTVGMRQSVSNQVTDTAKSFRLLPISRRYSWTSRGVSGENMWIVGLKAAMVASTCGFCGA